MQIVRKESNNATSSHLGIVFDIASKTIGELSIFSSLAKLARQNTHPTCNSFCHGLKHMKSENPDSINSGDWEEWKHDIPFFYHMFAGSCAGLAEHSIMFPLDTMKTRLQAYKGVGIRKTIEQIATNYNLNNSKKGFYMREFYRGIPAVWLGVIPAHAALFLSYETAKSHLGTDNPLSSALCGAASTFSHDCILTPVDVVKQRLQLGCYRNLRHCVFETYTKEGLIAFYRSMPTTIVMNIPYGAILISANESLKRFIDSQFKKYEETRNMSSNNHVSLLSRGLYTFRVKYPLAEYFLCAGLSGGLASLLTTPLDVIKTRLQTQDLSVKSVLVNAGDTLSAVEKASKDPYKYKNFLSTLKLILAEEGMRGFLKGAFARMAIGAPSAAICWGTYETVKYLLLNHTRKTSIHAQRTVKKNQ